MSCFQQILPIPLPAQGPNGVSQGPEVSPTVRGHKPGPQAKAGRKSGFFDKCTVLNSLRFEYLETGGSVQLALLPTTLYRLPQPPSLIYMTHQHLMGNPSTMASAQYWHFLEDCGVLWMGKLGTEWLQHSLQLAEGTAGQEQRGPGLGTRAFSLMCWWWFHFAIRAQRIQGFLCTLYTPSKAGENTLITS